MSPTLTPGYIDQVIFPAFLHSTKNLTVSGWATTAIRPRMFKNTKAQRKTLFLSLPFFISKLIILLILGKVKLKLCSGEGFVEFKKQFWFKATIAHGRRGPENYTPSSRKSQ